MEAIQILALAVFMVYILRSIRHNYRNDNKWWELVATYSAAALCATNFNENWWLTGPWAALAVFHFIKFNVAVDRAAEVDKNSRNVLQ